MRTCLFNNPIPVLLIVPLMLAGCAVPPPGAVTERIFRGEATFNKLEPSMQRSPLTGACPAPAIGRIRYAFRTFPGDETLGKVDYAVVERSKGVTGLSMTSVGDRPDGLFGNRGWPSSSGRVLSCGGLFTIAFREQRADKEVPLTGVRLELIASAQAGSYDVKMPNRRYEVTQITGYSGSLFPLKVGNELTFSYTALFQSGPDRKDYADNRNLLHVRYSVLSVNEAFRVDDKPVPGNVYLIEREVSGDGDTSRRDFYYSESLGWIVMEVEYDDGTPLLVMGMTGWDRPSLF